MKTKRTKRTTTLAAAWAKRAKLYAEGDKLWAEGAARRAEGAKLRTEGDKCHVDGDRVWINAWIAVYGKDSVVEWTEPKGDR